MANRGEPGPDRHAGGRGPRVLASRVLPSTRRSRALTAGVLLAVPAVAVTLLFGTARHTPSPANASAPAPSQPEPTPSAETKLLPGASKHRIRDVQGTGHVSPLRGKAVALVPGVVTAVTSNGFWMQDPRPDRNDATSEGVFVFTRTRPSVAVGHDVRVDGHVREFRTGGARSPGLGRTEIDETRTAVEARGVALPAPVVLGPGGRRPPASVVDGDRRAGGPAGDVESGGRFVPGRDAIDFYESLEGMRVTVRNAVAVGPSSGGEIAVLAAGGAGAGIRTARGGLLERERDANPERILLDDALAPLPVMNVGDRLPGATDGVLDYALGAFKLLPTATPRGAVGAPARENTRPAGRNELAVATADLRGLSPNASSARFEALAADLVDGLGSPDLVMIGGLRDNSGADDDGTVAADQTVAELITAISAAGGPPYDWRSIPPLDNDDGGVKGSNDHVGFLFRGDRGLAFVDRPASEEPGGEPGGAFPGDRASTPVKALPDGSGGVRLSLSPGRIAPRDPVWSRTRKPVAAELNWRGTPLIVVAASYYPPSGDDQPLFGRYQPPIAPTTWRRAAQAEVLAGFVRSVRAVDKNAGIIVAGDLNEPEYAPPVQELVRAAGLRDLPAALPEKDRYTAITAGNARALDHILLSPSLARHRHEYDIVHRNSEFADRAGERDPAVVRIDLRRAGRAWG